jgi:threonine dehydrogenase-like Zn-dependent dehydrogenase
VTDISDERLGAAKRLIPAQKATNKGIELIYVNTSEYENPIDHLLSLTEGHGYDDVFVYAPIKVLVEQGDLLLAKDGCMNFFAGPTDHEFEAPINLYNVHYSNTHIMGSTGGNIDDLKEALALSAAEKLNPSVMISHIGGLDATIETLLDLPKVPGNKKLIYNHIEMPLTAIEDFGKLGETNPLFKTLDVIVQNHGGLWNPEAETYLLNYFNVL